ncbi:MAG: hypothetical protein ACO3FX_07715, partial [Gemmobacter sp.]
MRAARALGLIARLAGCAASDPADAPPPAAAPAPIGSPDVARHFAELEAQLLRTGLLRRASGAADAPVGARR